jgi:hypothetical protein
MSDARSKRVRTVRLEFGGVGDIPRESRTRADLSAVASSAGFLWLATDEGAAIERLQKIDDGRYGEHKAFDLTGMLSLPVSDGDPEIDIEGLHCDEGFLWLVGSHALTRDKPELDENKPQAAIDELADIDRNPNRRILARIPLALLGESESPGSSNDDQVAQLKAKKKGSALLDALAGDRHLGPFMEVPAKENGFDIEGIVVRGSQVLLGLRGPVLRGWAIILELRVDASGKKLKLRPVTTDGRRYRKHFLDLMGCGIRDLGLLDGDLLILSGPTMDLDGPTRVHRWRPPTLPDPDTITGAEGCPVILEIPAGQGTDHAEGIVVVEKEERTKLLVIYDSPGRHRIEGEQAVHADLLAMGD